MINKKGLVNYRKYWGNKINPIDKETWDKNKILKITISNDFEKNLKDLKFSNHSLSKEKGSMVLRLKIPYNYDEVDDFKSKVIELLGIEKNWILDFSIKNSNCTHLSVKK
tara:strand:- start:3188 stop:3517 length:330 start_codon:yes stop_codon:yes gene_type:complete